MKYTDLLISIIFLSIFSWSVSSFINIYSDLKSKNNDYIERTNANDFISRSFKKTCEGTGFQSLNEWQKNCKALWNLKYIGWSDATSVMLISDKFKNHAFYGVWIGENYKGEVYWKD